ncbi:MAG: hypothetical protein Q9160_000695 [Pyrenula sp. 1 TL-2023]
MRVAMMSRPVAGVRNRTLILTLPGSPKGAKENLQAILKLLPHACVQAAGEDSRSMHAGGIKKLEADAGVSAANPGFAPNTSSAHSHGHVHQIPKPHSTPAERAKYRSNDPRAGPAQRYRQSPYPMLSVPEALSLVRQHTPSPISISLPLTPSLTGTTISQDIRALEAVPAFAASIVDGYAVHTDALISLKGSKPTLPVVSVSHADAASNPPFLPLGSLARITTGAPLPPNANAVIMVEDTVVASTKPVNASTSNPKLEEESTITLLSTSIAPNENVRDPGSDIPLNSLLLKAGTALSPLGGEIGLLAASGVKSVPVFRLPRLGVLSTGDEVMDIRYSSKMTGGMIRDSNRPSLIAAITSWDLCSDVIDLGIARDTPSDALETALRDALQLKDLDIIVTTGGVSMGELDLLKPVIERSLGGTVHFGRLRMKPGKPTTFATIDGVKSPSSSNASGGRETSRKRLIFALPGNPASALVTSQLFVRPSLEKLTGRHPENTALQHVPVKIDMQEGVKCDPARTEYHRVVVSVGKDGYLWAKSTGGQRSSKVGSLKGANALLVLPEKEGRLDYGDRCEALLLGPLGGS